MTRQDDPERTGIVCTERGRRIEPRFAAHPQRSRRVNQTRSDGGGLPRPTGLQVNCATPQRGSAGPFWGGRTVRHRARRLRERPPTSREVEQLRTVANDTIRRARHGMRGQGVHCARDGARVTVEFGASLCRRDGHARSRTVKPAQNPHRSRSVHHPPLLRVVAIRSARSLE